MAIELRTPGVPDLPDVLDALASWQFEGAPFQLHPGDIGWFWRHGARATAEAVRVWSRDGQVLAVGLLDEPDLLRLAIAPDAHQDFELARALVGDLAAAERGVLPAGAVALELARDVAVHEVLDEAGWHREDPWSVLRHDLTAVPEVELRVEVVGPELAPVWAAVHGAAFGGDPSDEPAVLERWRAMASGAPFTDARCLVGFDARDLPVAAVTVWSAGPGRHGIIEPMGVHPQGRGHGYGRSMNIAAAAAMGDLGCSAGFVCTPSSNVGAVATYRSAGYELLHERLDRTRGADSVGGEAELVDGPGLA